MSIKWINDIVYWLISSGALSGLFIFAWKYLKPVLETKKSHAKTEQEKALLSLVEQLADSAVTSLVSNNNITGSDKFKAATQTVSSTLADKGFDVSRTTVEHAVQSAYEKSDLTPSVDPNKKAQTGVVVNHG
ncbi:MAG: phage holin, LLH family [Ruminococcus flavefaciens]|nr:phage holin, LLH family [Ruminococcus flavefaciens]